MNTCVISGGGPKGSFAVGALKALNDRGVVFHNYYGTSTGALIAPFAALGRLAYLEDMYTTITPKQIYGSRKWWEVAFNPGFYHFRPLRLKLEADLTEEDYVILSNRIGLTCVATFNLTEGDTNYWYAGDVEGGRKAFIRAMLASASIPIVNDPIDILRNKDRHVDGGVRDILPLSKAVRDFPESNILAITMGAPMERDENIKGILEIAQRTLTAMTAEMLENDLRARMMRNGGILDEKYRLVKLENAYVGGLGWTSQDMRKQFAHGYAMGEQVNIPASWKS